MADHTIKPATPDAPSAHVPGTGPERNLHQDHGTARETLEAAKTIASQSASDASEDAKATASGFAAKASETIGQTAEQLRRTADETADRLKRTATDAISQAHERASETSRTFQNRGSETIDRARDWANDAVETGARRYADLRDRGGHHLSRGQSAVERFVGENPVLVGVVGLAAGMLIGALLPRTRREDQAVGAWADDLRDQGMRYARDATERGRQFVETALDQAQDAASAAANAAAEELKQPREGQAPGPASGQGGQAPGQTSGQAPGQTSRPGGTIQTH
ncbi:hypothetical protein [Methylobacterium oryzisoli]|uniref:hypothetical protein n=1 Tax=Methylobacterium oryzisoli TaxID=3385502 RepID=UPI00389131F9